MQRCIADITNMLYKNIQNTIYRLETQTNQQTLLHAENVILE